MRFKVLFAALAFALMFFSLAAPAQASHFETRVTGFDPVTGAPVLGQVLVADVNDFGFRAGYASPFFNPFVVTTRTAFFDPFFNGGFVAGRRVFVGVGPRVVVGRRAVVVRRGF